MWYPIIKNLRDYLLSLPDFTGISIGVGPIEFPGESSTIKIIHAHDKKLSYQNGETGVTAFWLECTVRNSDPDPEAAYELLYDLESKVQAAIKTWSETLWPALGIAPKVETIVVLSDNKLLYPLAGSKAFCQVEWRKR